MKLRLRAGAVILITLAALTGCGKKEPEPGTVKDEALTAGAIAEKLSRRR